MSNWYSLPDCELMLDTWGDKNGASCQYSPVSSNLLSAMPEMASLYVSIPRWISPENLSRCLLTIGDFFSMLLLLCGLWPVFVRTSELVAIALVAAFLINVNWELGHGFKHSLCPCKEDIFAGTI